MFLTGVERSASPTAGDAEAPRAHRSDSSLRLILRVVITDKNHKHTLNLPPPPSLGNRATNPFTRPVSIKTQLQKTMSEALLIDSSFGAEQPDLYE